MKSIEYYQHKFGSDKTKALVHLVKEVGELAGSIEKGNDPAAQYELVEIAGLCHFLASTYGVHNLNEKIEEVYAQKLQKREG